jgi:hypothetical protein
MIHIKNPSSPTTFTEPCSFQAHRIFLHILRPGNSAEACYVDSVDTPVIVSKFPLVFSMYVPALLNNSGREDVPNVINGSIYGC